MTPEEPLRRTTTHAADETEGRLFSLDLPRVKWVLLAWGLGLLPGMAVLEPLGLAWASAIVFGPACVVAAFQFLLLQNQPPGWFTDWIETRLTGGHLSPLRDHQP